VIWGRWHGRSRSGENHPSSLPAPLRHLLLARRFVEDEALARLVGRREGLALLRDDFLPGVPAPGTYDLVEARLRSGLSWLVLLRRFRHDDAYLSIGAGGLGVPGELPQTTGVLHCSANLPRYHYVVGDPWLRNGDVLCCGDGNWHCDQGKYGGPADVRALAQGVARGGEVPRRRGRPLYGPDNPGGAAVLLDEHEAARSITAAHLRRGFYLLTGKADRRISRANIPRPSSRWLYRQTYSFKYPCSHLAETA